MPPIINTPLPEDAKGELIPADEKLSKSRGNLNWWNLMILMGMVLALSVAYNATLQGQIKDLKVVVVKQGAKIDSLQNVITDMLKQQINDLRPAKQAAINAEVKTDSLIKNISK